MSRRKRVDVQVDVHEPTAVVEAVMEHEDVEEFELTELDSADIVVDGRIGFERKTPSDFASSMTEEDNRLRDQVERMVEDYDAAFVLIEGNLSDFSYLSHTNVEDTSLRGFIASIEARYGVSVVLCDKRDLLVDMAVRYGRKHVEDPPKELKIESSVERNAPVVKRMLGCVDGVGSDTADTIFQKYQTIPDLLAAIDGDLLEDIEGVGPKTAENIENALL